MIRKAMSGEKFAPRDEELELPRIRIYETYAKSNRYLLIRAGEIP
jgi:hypothetical protein